MNDRNEYHDFKFSPAQRQAAKHVSRFGWIATFLVVVFWIAMVKFFLDTM